MTFGWTAIIQCCSLIWFDHISWIYVSRYVCSGSIIIHSVSGPDITNSAVIIVPVLIVLFLMLAVCLQVVGFGE